MAYRLLNAHQLIKLFSLIIILCITSILQAQELTDIPINLNTHTPVVTGYIENKKIRLSFDSGARMPLILKKNILEQARGVHFTGKYRSSTDAAGRKHKNPEFKLRQIRLENYAMHNVIGNLYTPWGIRFNIHNASADLISKDESPTLDGVFGLDIFQHKRLIIDYPNEKLIILHRDYFPEPYKSMPWLTCHHKINNAGIVLEANFLGKKGLFLLDTGATASFIKPSFLENTNQNTHITGDFRINKNAKAIKMKFYLYDFALTQVDGILGYNFFADKKIYIQYKKNKKNTERCLISY